MSLIDTQLQSALGIPSNYKNIYNQVHISNG